MKSRLNELTLAEFIELLCGNYRVLMDNNDEVDNADIEARAHSLIGSYRFLADKAGMKAVLVTKEGAVKCKMKIFFLRICTMLVMQGAYDEVRSLLAMIDEDITEANNNSLQDRVDELLRYAIFEQHRSEETRNETANGNKPSSDDIRAYYDAEIAFIMTYIKMTIDMYTINAAVYANIVNQVNVDIMSKRRALG